MKRRQSIALRYLLVSWVSLFRWVALVATVVLMAVVVLTQDPKMLIVAGVSAGLLLLSLLIFFLESPGVRCLMCGANLLRKLACIPHRNAKKVCGSHTLRATLRLASYPALMDCPYCDGHFRLGGRKGREERVRRRRTGEPSRSHRLSPRQVSSSPRSSRRVRSS